MLFDYVFSGAITVFLTFISPMPSFAQNASEQSRRF